MRTFVMLCRCPSLIKIILVGDQEQLQPYVSDHLRELGYGISTMERLLNGRKDKETIDNLSHHNALH